MVKLTIYWVVDKTTGENVYQYSNDTPGEWEGMDFDAYDHIAQPSTTPLPDPIYVSRRMSKLEFIDRLGNPAYLAILAMAKVNIEVEAFVKRFEMTTPDPDGTSVDLSDPRTIVGVTLIGAALVAQGVVGEDWASGVLHG